MSTEAVKKLILTAISALNIPLDRIPSERKVSEACSAAKLLRNRVLREHARVEEHIELLRQKQLYNDSDDEAENMEFQEISSSPDIKKLARHDFIFINEMMVMENVIVPLLLAHGMNFSSSLLPQLLKLLTAMLLPIPKFSIDEPRQKDYVRRLIERCGTDEFFTLLIQCVAPVAEKRSKGGLQKDDVILLEVVLKMITHFFTGPKESISSAVGAFSRNHGIELFLVVLNQNYARNESRKNEENNKNFFLKNDKIENSKNEKDENFVLLDDDHKDEKTGIFELEEEEKEDDKTESKEEEEQNEEEEGDDDDDDDDSESEISESNESSNIEEVAVDQFNAQMLELLESDEQLWKWNMHIVTSMAAILRCANPVELGQLGFVSKFKQQSSQQLIGLFGSGKRFRECKKESDHWRYVARSRVGAISSNSLLVKGTSFSRSQGEGGAIGSTSTLLGLRSKDPLEKVKDIDLRKKGRFVKGLVDDTSTICSLPLPTKIQLAQQCLSFVCYGFEPLNMMVWNKLVKTISGFESVVRERNELISGYKSSGEDIELPYQLDKSVYDSVQNVLDYIDICASLLRYTREVIRLSREENGEIPSAEFRQQWQSISSVIGLDHFSYGFELLRIFLISPELKKKFDIINIGIYLSELFMTLNHLLEGEIVKDNSVIVAANALASSVLYNEENISLIFDLISRSSAKIISPGKAGILILLVYSVMRLMEKCSFRGNVIFPKKIKRNETNITSETEDTGNTSNLESDELYNNIELSSPHEVINDSEDNNNNIEIKKDYILNSSPAPFLLGEVEINSIAPSNDEKREYSVENNSLSSSGNALISTLSSEREVSMGNYFRRLTTLKNIKIIISSLRHWRANDTDVNAGLVYLIQSLVIEGYSNVFFNAPFLIIIRDILSNGEFSHNTLYEVCDKLIYDFFNPSFAKLLDERKKNQFGSSINVLNGAQSFLGFEVSLRCARSLFCFNSTDYNILEEKGLPHLMDSTVIPLNNETYITEEKHNEDSPISQDSPVKKRHRKKKKSNEKEEEEEEKEEHAIEFFIEQKEEEEEEVV